MSKLPGTKSKNVYHRKDYAGGQISKRVTCKLCGIKHYCTDREIPPAYTKFIGENIIKKL